jgi:pimeloyl-ACP methyl ester carboxylesterase
MKRFLTPPFLGVPAIPVSVFGDGDRCLVCVNAAQQTAAAWGAVARRFTRAGFRVVLFDFPSQGRAETLSRGLGLVEQAEIVHRVLSHVSPGQPVDLCGASWGALVAAACAARHPAAVRRLILGSFQVRTNERLRRLAARSVTLIEREETGLLAELFIGEFGEGLPEAFRQAMRAQFVRLTAAQLVQMREQCLTLAAGADLRDLVDLERISAEILVVNGARDPLIDASDLATIAQCLPQAEVVVVPRVGHFLHLERPSVLDIHLEFAQRPGSASVPCREPAARSGGHRPRPAGAGRGEGSAQELDDAGRAHYGGRSAVQDPATAQGAQELLCAVADEERTHHDAGAGEHLWRETLQPPEHDVLPSPSPAYGRGLY